ncbi:hypothetical protein JTE90_007108 [Oedothorax gibbosus]|uniref:Uncharacterized protein n=1 Tax=Oedothorax gibbosus TaxID=931172 RepID=A0AAV6VT02_9ARAC|nr:hypothetical protein JTE90_007108 [Oedothorax gibbosus]
MDVDLEIDEVNLSEDQKNIIQNMVSLFPKAVTANFVNVLRNSLHEGKTPKKQSTLDGWLRKSISPKTNETSSSKKQQSIPSSSSRSPEESNEQDSQIEGLQNESVGLENSNNALQNDSSSSIKESVELDSEKMNMQPLTDEELVKKMVSEKLTIELKRVEIGNPSVQKQLATLTPKKKTGKVKNIREKILNRNKNASNQIHFDCNGPSNEMSTNDSDKQSSGFCEKVDMLDVDSLASPKNKVKTLYMKESNGLPDNTTSSIEVCQDSFDVSGKCDSLDTYSLPSPKKKRKRHDIEESSAVSRKDITISDASLATSNKTENNDSASSNVNNDNSSPVQSSANILPSPRKTRRHNKKESNTVSRKDDITISDASLATSDKTENKDSAYLADDVNNNDSSPVHTSAISLPSLRKKPKRHDKKESSTVSQKDDITISDASLAISDKTEKKNSASSADNVNNNNSSPVQSSAISFPSPRKKTRRRNKKESSTVSRKDDITISDASSAIPDKTEKKDSASSADNVNNDNSSPVQSSAISLPRLRIKTRRHDKKESSSVKTKEVSESSNASPAISHETEKDSDSLADNVNNDNASPVQSLANSLPSPRKKKRRHDKKELSSVKTNKVSESSNASPAFAGNVNVDNSSPVQATADSLPSPKKKIKRHHDNKEPSYINRKAIIENSDANTAISEETEERNTAPLAINVNNSNSSLGQSSVVPPTKIWIRKTRQTNRRLSLENELTCSLSNDADKTYFIVKENDETDISENITLISQPVQTPTSRRLRTKLKNGVDSDNKSTDPSSLIGQPEAVVINQREKRSRTLSKESKSSSNRTRQDSSPIGSGTQLENGMDSNNKCIENDETSLKETAIKQTSKRSRTVSKETVSNSIGTRQGSSPIESKEYKVLESKSSLKLSKKNKKSNQTAEISEKPNEDFVSTERLDHLREVVHHLNELVEATEESGNESSDAVSENTSSKTSTICGGSENEEIESQASGKAGRLTVQKKMNKKLESDFLCHPKQNVIIENGIGAAEIQKINRSGAEQVTRSKVNDTTTTKTTENMYKKVYLNKRHDGVQNMTGTINSESEITQNQSITSKTKRIATCKIKVASELSNVTDETLAEDAVLDCDLVKDCIGEDGSVACSNNLPEMKENGNNDSSESNNQTGNEVHATIRTIQSTRRTNQRKAKRIRKFPCNSNLVDEQPQINDSSPNEVDLNHLQTPENETIHEQINLPATEISSNSSITVEDILCGEGSQTSSVSAEKQKNFEQFCIVKEVSSSLDISLEQLFQNRKLTKELKSPSKSDAVAFISGHKFKSGQTVPSVFKVDSKEQFKNILQSYETKI